LLAAAAAVLEEHLPILVVVEVLGECYKDILYYFLQDLIL
jgi:hypothetical protein